MAAREIDLDKVVDYRAEYTAVVQKYKLTGDKLTGLCPFHEDRNNSFSVDLKTGKWHCFSEDRGGNFVSFWAEFHGVDTKEAYKQILEKYGVSTEAAKPAKKEKAAVLEDQPCGVRLCKAPSRRMAGQNLPPRNPERPKQWHRMAVHSLLQRSRGRIHLPQAVRPQGLPLAHRQLRQDLPLR